MNAIRRLIGLFRDSPTYGRDRANLISGFSVGSVGLLLNAAVLMLVLPLMLDPDDRDFRHITENVEFGQLLALILLAGAAAFATFLIPLRLMGVFMGPRIGRYFDQIVLSGISPLRFVIGKATSQNLFLCLILFLLLPYLVLSLTLGGVDFGSFIAGLFLVWLYCIALALVTLWASLYMNEVLAAVVVMASAAFISALGFAPFPYQPFVVTPFPALIHPVYRSIPFMSPMILSDFLTVFLTCATGMTIVIFVSLFAIYLGPLYGIVRENSTFGEVVRPGDSQRKRRLRFRLHIQRPSEIAFFYENRSERFRRNEGLIRWGVGFCGLTLLSIGAYVGFVALVSYFLAARGGRNLGWGFAYDFHTTYLVIHGMGLVLAMLLFSHPKNTTFLRLPFFRGRKTEVSKLDTISFLLFAAISTAAAFATPFWFEQSVALPLGGTILSAEDLSRSDIDLLRIATEGTFIVTLTGLVIYAIHRLTCLSTWMRSVSLFATAGIYFATLCLIPLFMSAMVFETRELRNIRLLAEWAPTLAMVSPFTAILDMFDELGRQFPDGISTVPYYIVHGLVLSLTLLGIHRRGRTVRKSYLAEPEREAN